MTPSNTEETAAQNRVPLSEAVSDCVKRWFHDTLEAAKSGDADMQMLVSQMYFTGYGVPTNPQQGQAWMTKASRSQSSTGCNCNESDSDRLKGDKK